MNINSILENFAKNELVLSHNDIERHDINVSIENLKKNLKNYFRDSITEIKIFGSYSRNTILPRKYDLQSDIDLLIVFNTEYGLKTPETYRNHIKSAMAYYYPKSKIYKDFPTVKLELNHIMFDIVPSFLFSTFIFDSYKIPDSKINWISTSPDDIKGKLGISNTMYGNNKLRSAIRLCKSWNATHGYQLNSYEMESEIIDLNFNSNSNTFDYFIHAIGSVAGHISGVSQALEYIDKYSERMFGIIEANPEKQLQWIKKLLPNLKV